MKINLSKYEVAVIVWSLSDAVDYYREQMDKDVDIDKTFYSTLLNLEMSFREKMAGNDEEEG